MINYTIEEVNVSMGGVRFDFKVRVVVQHPWTCNIGHAPKWGVVVHTLIYKAGTVSTFFPPLLVIRF